MKKASEILLLIGFILAIIGAVSLLICAIVFFVLGSPSMREAIIEGINNGTIVVNGYSGSAEEIANVYQAAMLGSGFGMLVGMAVEIAGAIVCFMARQRKKQGLYIATIVLGALGAGACLIVGAIFGIVALGQQPAQEQPAELE